MLGNPKKNPLNASVLWKLKFSLQSRDYVIVKI